MYLTGASNPASRAVAQRLAIGLMVQPGSGYERQIGLYRWWAADNGCFNPKTYPGHDGWLKWLDGLPRDGCLFAVVPDVARRPDGTLGGDPAATWDQFQRYAPKVAALGFPTALAAQDGIEDMDNLDEQLAAADCLFIGGSTEWKTSEAALAVAKRADEFGCWTHMGRVNSYRRYAIASAAGLDSADGTFLAFGPDVNIKRLERWLLRGAQLGLPLEAS